jgi:hypothetical protein
VSEHYLGGSAEECRQKEEAAMERIRDAMMTGDIAAGALAIRDAIDNRILAELFDRLGGGAALAATRA